MLRFRVGTRGHIEPLEAVYRTASTMQAGLETLAPSDQPLRRMIGRLGRVAYVSVEKEIGKIDTDLRIFFNVNTREDLDAAEKMLLKNLRRNAGQSRGTVKPWESG